ncbi:hypothetical protein E1301_Tti003527 [Triplophysa tibetana]|uniref:CARD domain-containing protein n=1 Tax=Triplophysa tibetana TaxID=1572043 RepID=A0A5A9PUI3_9TELE|nr:hypothetical protein E1301_Tti003527 [Triplophysa tibetana]
MHFTQKKSTRTIQDVAVGTFNVKMFGSGSKKWFMKKNTRQRNKGKKPVNGRKKKWIAKVLKLHRERILQELDVNKVLPYLVYDEVFSLEEYKEILAQDTSKKRTELFLDQLFQKGPSGFNAFCSVLEEVCPHLLTCFLLDCQDGSAEGNKKQGQTKASHGQANALSKRQETVCFLPMYTDPVFDTRVFPKHDKDKYGPAVYYPKISAFIGTPESVSVLDESEGSAHGKPSLRRIKGRIHRSKSLDSIDLLDSNPYSDPLCRNDLVPPLEKSSPPLPLDLSVLQCKRHEIPFSQQLCGTRWKCYSQGRYRLIKDSTCHMPQGMLWMAGLIMTAPLILLITSVSFTVSWLFSPVRSA